MIIYIEKQAKEYPQTKKILEKFKNSQVIYINNYKNLFDKNYNNIDSKKALIIAKLNTNSVSDAPIGYGHTKQAFFFKTSLNCIFDCSYCYLKGAFKNENMVIFVNYDDIKKDIEEKLKNISPHPSPLPKGEGIDQLTVASSLPLGEIEGGQNDIWFYSSDYSDILGMDMFSGFCEEFIEFFEKFGPHPNPLLSKAGGQEVRVKMEIRTKSSNIKPLLDLGFVPKNTEIAFSLNPQILIDKYEKSTSSLDARIEAINKLISLGFKVGIRFLPLLPINDYEKIYGEFINYIGERIDFCKINSTFASGLLYTKKDYNKILSKYPELDILHMLDLDNDGFYRESKKVRDNFYTMFKNLDNKCILCLEY
ncbi:MAG: hypothetical protein Q8K30_05645 [Candidatus Gracilibacteria bacterium]|nr:hypothetical protein [Candidatus Gracilibacteria bacterium]